MESALMCELNTMKAHEGNDIIEHLTKLKRLWDRVTLISGETPSSEAKFKQQIGYSLPMSWDEFVCVLNHSPDKKDAPLPSFIGKCMEEHCCHTQCVKEVDSKSQYAGNPKLINRISKKKLENAKKGKDKEKMHCTMCRRDNHNTKNCFHAGKIKCFNCKKFGHKKADCHSKKKSEGSQKSKDQKVADATLTKKESHVAEETNEGMTLIATEEDALMEEDLKNDVYMHDAYIGMNFSLRMCDWLVDSGSTNHIVNDWKLFTMFQPMKNAIVYGIGGKTTQVLGCGTVPLTARNGEIVHEITLTDVNYIPSNKYNIFSLGHWDADGRTYRAAHGNLTLYDAQEQPLLVGQNMDTNMYKIKLWLRNSSITNTGYVLSCVELKRTWGHMAPTFWTHKLQRSKGVAREGTGGRIHTRSCRNMQL